MSLAKMLLTTFGALSPAATASAQIRSAAITGAVTDQSGALAPNAEVVTTNCGSNFSGGGFGSGQTADIDVNLKVATVEAAAPSAQIQSAQTQAGSLAVTNATDTQVINHVLNVTQNHLFYAMLQNGVQPSSETSTSTSGDYR